MTKSLYAVTAAAPSRVAGYRVAEGDVLSLTVAEAMYERDLGHIAATSAEALAAPADLTESERASLPALVGPTPPALPARYARAVAPTPAPAAAPIEAAWSDPVAASPAPTE